jgi:hypothetical protein
MVIVRILPEIINKSARNLWNGAPPARFAKTNKPSFSIPARRAKIINAEGEQQAAEKLVAAGRMLAPEPCAMQLRYFAALHDIARRTGLYDRVPHSHGSFR